MKSGIRDDMMLLLGWNPKSLGDAVILVNLLIVAARDPCKHFMGVAVGQV